MSYQDQVRDTWWKKVKWFFFRAFNYFEPMYYMPDKVTEEEFELAERMKRSPEAEMCVAMSKKTIVYVLERERETEILFPFLKWLTDEKCMYAIMYGGTPQLEKDFRFASQDKDYTIQDIIRIYLNEKTKKTPKDERL